MVKETSRELLASVNNTSMKQVGHVNQTIETNEPDFIIRLKQANGEAISAIAKSNSRNSLNRIP